MRIEGRYRFAAPRQRVWAALQDPATLAATLPGVRRLEVLEPDRYAVSLDLGVGAVRGTYDGVVTVADRVEGEACTLRGSGRGAAAGAPAPARAGRGAGGGRAGRRRAGVPPAARGGSP